MLIVLSPAKKLDFGPAPLPADLPLTEPAWPKEASRLARSMRNLSLRDLRGLMDLSDDLARLNRDRFRAWADDPAPDAVRPAMMAFAGDTYVGLDARTLGPDDLRYAQAHLRILSGLYGLLRPLDTIQPYRLEMGSRLKTRRGANLYDFWGDAIADRLTTEAAAVDTDTLIACASEEYFHAARRPALRLRVIQPVFLEEKAGQRSIVSFFAKRARGAMARFILLNRVTDPAHLRDFDTGGYRWDAEASSPDRPVFVRHNLA